MKKIFFIIFLLLSSIAYAINFSLSDIEPFVASGQSVVIKVYNPITFNNKTMKTKIEGSIILFHSSMIFVNDKENGIIIIELSNILSIEKGP